MSKKKRTTGRKLVALFPSTYHETEDMALTWVDPQGKWLAKWCRATYKDKMQRNEAWRFIPLSAYFWDLTGYYTTPDLAFHQENQKSSYLV